MTPTPVKSARRVIEIFEFFAERQAPAKLTEIARSLGYPASSTFVLLKSLQELGYLDYDRNDRTFLPTLRSALLGIWVNDRLLSNGTISRLMFDLRGRIGETVVLGAQSGLAVQYIHVVRSLTRRNPSQVMTGSLRPLLTSAMGHVILSSKSEGEVLALMRRINAEQKDSKQWVRQRDLLAKLERCRRDGYASSEAAATPGAGIVAMLLASPQHQPTMALGIGAPLSRLREQKPQYVAALRKVVDTHRRHMERGGVVKKVQ
jgi:DNA-binding IclR family transcriptional regulator